jgi:hypothetical protein
MWIIRIKDLKRYFELKEGISERKNNEISTNSNNNRSTDDNIFLIRQRLAKKIGVQSVSSSAMHKLQASL